jgi:hypothetical protein
MSDIKIITEPDIIFDQSFKFLMINPKTDIKKFVEEKLSLSKKSTTIFIYEDKHPNIKWLLTVCNLSDFTVIDLDNCDENTSQFFSYLISIPTTYYRCDHMKAEWNLMNPNRFYDFEIFNKLL